jgi:type IV pilus assembly protein PilP
VYAAENKRDPFKTYFDELLVQEKEQRNVSELQRFELGTLTLVGVVAGTATPMALIEDPSGKGHTIKIGSLMGKNFGQVKQIRRGEIDVQEEFRDFTGKRIRSMKTLRLKPEEEIR